MAVEDSHPPQLPPFIAFKEPQTQEPESILSGMLVGFHGRTVFKYRQRIIKCCMDPISSL